jgi:hypothetical protein
VLNEIAGKEISSVEEYCYWLTQPIDIGQGNIGTLNITLVFSIIVLGGGHGGVADLRNQLAELRDMVKNDKDLDSSAVETKNLIVYKTLGASHFWEAVGLSPYLSPYDLFLIMTGQKPKNQDTVFTKRGVSAEGDILDKYKALVCNNSKYAVTVEKAEKVSRGNVCCIADAIVQFEDRIIPVEVKFSSLAHKNLNLFMPQIQAECEFYDAEIVHVVMLSPHPQNLGTTHCLRIWRVQRCPLYWERLWMYLKVFIEEWQKAAVGVDKEEYERPSEEVNRQVRTLLMNNLDPIKLNQARIQELSKVPVIVDLIYDDKISSLNAEFASNLKEMFKRRDL